MVYPVVGTKGKYKMKKLFAIILSVMLIIILYGCAKNNSATSASTNTTLTGPWEALGNEGFSAGNITTPSFCIDNGVQYMAYEDFFYGHKITVMKYSGNKWINVGSPGFSTGGVGYTALSASNGTPYVAYQDWGNNTLNGTMTVPVTVKYFNGTNWLDVGHPDFSAGGVQYVALVVDKGNPYVAFSDFTKAQKITVMKYDAGTGWNILGTAGFSVGQSKNISIGIYAGMPCVSYLDIPNANAVRVQVYNGASWADLGGSPGRSVDYDASLALHISASGIPYVAFQDADNSQFATVKQYTGGAWNTVGLPGFSQGRADYISIYEGSTITAAALAPVVSFQDNANLYRATVMVYDNNTNAWLYMGSPGFSKGAVFYTNVVVYNNAVYVAYEDENAGYKATVRVLK